MHSFLTNSCKKMRQEEASLAELPSDVMIDIFSRLPINTLISCKFVCKSWLNLLTSLEFAKCHLPKSNPSLVFTSYELDRKNPSLHHVTELESYSTFTVSGLMEFSGSRKDMAIRGSINGLMFCRMVMRRSYSYYICNPITREYIKLPCPKKWAFPHYKCCGFGVSKTSGQYKVVKISFDTNHDYLMCEVYTLGTRSWRTIPFAPDVRRPLKYYDGYSKGEFLNGNLHWLAEDSDGGCWISCFDLETEQFSAFPTPVEGHNLELIASGECLHLIDYEYDDEIVVWSMEEYGVAESWTEESVISADSDLDGQSFTGFRVIHVFSNGDALISLNGCCLYYYSYETETSRVMHILEPHGRVPKYVGMLHSPSFLSLKSFAMEDVKSF